MAGLFSTYIAWKYNMPAKGCQLNFTPVPFILKETG